MSLSVLQKTHKASSVQIHAKPFPYILIEDALPEKIYQELDRTFPEVLVMNDSYLSEPNTYRYKSNPALLNNNRNTIPQIWTEFFEYHTSREYFEHCFNIFGQDLPSNKNVTIRNVDNSGDYVTDCQFVIHEPLPKNETTRTAHLDNPIEIYAGLLYMKKEHDDSTGGDFTIYEVQEPVATKDIRVVTSKIKPVATVPYKPNTFCMFLNVKNSVHGVTPRVNATEIRRSINIIGEFSPDGVERMWWQDWNGKPYGV